MRTSQAPAPTSVRPDTVRPDTVRPETGVVCVRPGPQVSYRVGSRSGFLILTIGLALTLAAAIQPTALWSQVDSGPRENVLPLEKEAAQGEKTPPQADSNGEVADAPVANAPVANSGVAGGPVRRAFVVPVSLPIVGEEDSRVKRVVDKLVSKLPEQGPRPILVLEFRPKTGQAGEASQFERSLSLARFLAGPRLSRVKTVAYLPTTVRGHAVLAAMACENLVIASDAEFGAAGIAEEFIDATLRRGYTEIAGRRHTIPKAVALGMLDKQLAVYRVNTLEGIRYVLAEELAELQGQAAVGEAETISPAGDFVQFSGERLRKLGFASHLAADRRELAAALELPPRALEENPAFADDWRAVRVDLRGRITAKSVNLILRSIEEARRRRQINFICLWIDSPGGSPPDSMRLASRLAELDPSEVRTVALVSGQARADAALPALACDDLVMFENAILGGPGDVNLGPEELDDLAQPLKQLARDKGRDWSPILGLLDDRLDVYRYEREGTGAARYFCGEELGDRVGWRRREKLELRRGVLARESERLGLARGVVRNYDELLQMYNLDEPPRMLKPPWAEASLERLASQPWFARTLLFIAFFALMSEFSSPGLGAAGFISLLCFLLFFWSQFLSGSAGWLEVLLFTGGALCVAIEIFVVPGLGIFGIGGGLMIVTSIVLASQTFVIPQNAYQMRQLPSSLFLVVFAGAGALTALFVMRRVLPDAPVFNRIMLRPPAAEERDEREQRESIVSWSHLQGKRGVVVTQLTPSGKARFGDDVVDVISEGELIERGASVYVGEVHGNRIVVFPVPGGR